MNVQIMDCLIKCCVFSLPRHSFSARYVLPHHSLFFFFFCYFQIGALFAKAIHVRHMCIFSRIDTVSTVRCTLWMKIHTLFDKMQSMNEQTKANNNLIDAIHNGTAYSISQQQWRLNIDSHKGRKKSVSLHT